MRQVCRLLVVMMCALPGVTAQAASEKQTGTYAAHSPALGPWRTAVRPPRSRKPEHPDQRKQGAPTQETWAGVEATRVSWAFYTGTTFAPFGHLHSDGLRFRVVSGYGRYWYDGTRRLGRTLKKQRFHGQQGFAELLAGYQWQSGPLIVKAFAGANIAGHTVTPLDPNSGVLGTQFGGLAAIETWYTLSEKNWISLNLAATTVDEAIKVELRIGHRLTEVVGIGLEGAHLTTDHDTLNRLGAFAQLSWGDLEVRLSGGMSRERGKSHEAYGTLNVLFAY